MDIQNYILGKLKQFKNQAFSGLQAITNPLPPPVNTLQNFQPQNQRQAQAYNQAQPYIQDAKRQYNSPLVQAPQFFANNISKPVQNFAQQAAISPKRFIAGQSWDDLGQALQSSFKTPNFAPTPDTFKQAFQTGLRDRNANLAGTKIDSDEPLKFVPNQNTGIQLPNFLGGKKILGLGDYVKQSGDKLNSDERNQLATNRITAMQNFAMAGTVDAGQGIGRGLLKQIEAKHGKDIAMKVSETADTGLAKQVLKYTGDKVSELIQGVASKGKISAGMSIKNVGETPLHQEARKYKTAEDFVKAQVQKETQAGEYVGSHQAPTRDGYNAPAHDLTGEGNIYPPDIYTNPRAYQIYGERGTPEYVAQSKKSLELLQKLKGKPDAEITIYRSAPKNVSEIRPGDWVTQNRDYAVSHGESNLNGQYNIIERKVRADELFTDGNSVNELGYDPRPLTKSQLTDIWNKATSAVSPDRGKKNLLAELDSVLARTAEFLPGNLRSEAEDYAKILREGKPSQSLINKAWEVVQLANNIVEANVTTPVTPRGKVGFSTKKVETPKPDIVQNQSKLDPRNPQAGGITIGSLVPKPLRRALGLEKTYKIINQEGIQEVKGKTVKIANGVETFIHQGTNPKRTIKGFVVSEKSTGRYLGEGNTEREAIANAKNAIQNVGESRFKKLISENQLSKNTESLGLEQPSGVEIPGSSTNGTANPRIGTSNLNNQGQALLEDPALLGRSEKLPRTTIKSVPENLSLKSGVPSPQEIASTIDDKINNFVQEVSGYSTAMPDIVGKGANVYTRTLRNTQDRLGKTLEHALGSANPVVRNATAVMQDFFRGISMSPERQAASANLRGGLSVSNQRAYDVMTSLYDTIKGNKESLNRINAVLDPAIAKAKVTFNDLNATEKQTYALIRKGLDLVHDISYANGAISAEKYTANLGKYTPRLYEPFELPAEVSTWVNSSTRKIQNDLYKSKTGINTWKTENALNDPVYALGKRLSQVQSNMAIREYTDYLASQTHLVSDIERTGFTKLSDSPAYGSLSGKYVLNSAAEDLKGAFFANEALQKVYDVFRAYDRLPIRQLQKKLLTVFNPTTNVGNIVSDNVFGFMVGVDPLTLNKNIYKLAKNKTELKTISDYLMRKGIIGTDITRTDFTSKIGSIDALAETKGMVKGLRAIPDKITSFYGGTDDMYKAGAFKALLDKGYGLEEATKLVGDAFQNYANVGKFYDAWAKTPIFGKAFIKFQGDLMRIIKNAAVNRPMHLASFLGALYGVAQLSSKLSGETPEDKNARETRFGAPTIPGLNIPLTWQTPYGEINVARYISPFYANNAGGDNTPLGIASKVLPGIPDFNFTKGGGLDIQKTIAKSAGDPLLGPLAQFAVNADFRGKPILDPNENKYQPSTLTPGEKTANGATWLARAYTPPVPNSLINVGAAAMGMPDQYGATRSVPQALARAAGIKVQTYGPEQIKQQQEKDLQYQSNANKSVHKQINQVTKDQLQGKITAEQAANRINYLQQQITPLNGETSSVGNVVSYLDKNGDLAHINVQKVIDLPESNNYQKQLKQDEALKLVQPLLESGKSEQEVSDLLTQIGITKEDAQYYIIAKQSPEAKIGYISDQLQNVSSDQLLSVLSGYRREVGGKSVLTSDGIDTLYQEGVITYDEKKHLKSLTYDKKTKTLKVKRLKAKKPKKPKKISIQKTSVKSVSFSKPRKARYRKLQQITFETPKPLKIKRIPLKNNYQKLFGL